MFKYMKRLLADIRFWWKEIKLRNEEDAELDRISDITFQEGYGGHTAVAGFAYYKEMQRNRAERQRLHKKQLAAIHQRYCAHAQCRRQIIHPMSKRQQSKQDSVRRPVVFFPRRNDET